MAIQISAYNKLELVTLGRLLGRWDTAGWGMVNGVRGREFVLKCSVTLL